MTEVLECAALRSRCEALAHPRSGRAPPALSCILGRHRACGGAPRPSPASSHDTRGFGCHPYSPPCPTQLYCLAHRTLSGRAVGSGAWLPVRVPDSSPGPALFILPLSFLPLNPPWSGSGATVMGMTRMRRALATGGPGSKSQLYLCLCWAVWPWESSGISLSLLPN